MFQVEQKPGKDQNKNKQSDTNNAPSSINPAEMLREQNKAFQRNSGMAQSHTEPVQMQAEEEEEEIQAKTDPAQMREEDEELIQGKMATAQMQAEEEEEIQPKSDSAKVSSNKKGQQTSDSSSSASSMSFAQMNMSLQAKMQNSFGTDFSNVNIHQNDNSATQMGALAYTQGNNVHFAPGQFNPNTLGGQELLGHELTHVVQQRQGRVQPTKQGGGLKINDNSSLEHEADVNGKTAIRGENNYHSASSKIGTNNNVVQGYFIDNRVDGVFRITDDLTAAVKEGSRNHQVFAKSEKVAEANEKLDAVGSGIKLEEQSKTKTFKLKDKEQEMVKLSPKNQQNNTTGDNMMLWAGCKKSCGVVVGSEYRKAQYQDKNKETKLTPISEPAGMKAYIMQQWLRKEMQSQANSKEEKEKIFEVWMEAINIKKEYNLLLSEINSENDELKRKSLSQNFFAKQEKYAETLWNYYYSLPEDKKLEIDEELKINTFVDPSVGEGYTMASGGNSINKKEPWNYHWAGIIMESDDKKDKITLENYATGIEDEQNTNWDIAMYGTIKKEQTFHEQHLKTGLHGDSPTTMHIKKGL